MQTKRNVYFEEATAKKKDILEVNFLSKIKEYERHELCLYKICNRKGMSKMKIGSEMK